MSKYTWLEDEWGRLICKVGLYTIVITGFGTSLVMVADGCEGTPWEMNTISLEESKQQAELWLDVLSATLQRSAIDSQGGKPSMQAKAAIDLVICCSTFHGVDRFNFIPIVPDNRFSFSPTFLAGDLIGEILSEEKRSHYRVRLADDRIVFVDRRDVEIVCTEEQAKP